MGKYVYKYEAVSVRGFLQQLAVTYVVNGYRYWVKGKVPKGKDPAVTYRRLLEKYPMIGLSPKQKSERRKQDLTNVQLLAYQRHFVMLATKGKPGEWMWEVERYVSWWEEEGKVVKNLEKKSLPFAGYCIGYKEGSDGKFHASVRLHPDKYKDLKKYFEARALSKSVKELTNMLKRPGVELYAPVKQQLFWIQCAVNRERKKAGLPLVPGGIIPGAGRGRISVKPFEKREICA